MDAKGGGSDHSFDTAPIRQIEMELHENDPVLQELPKTKDGTEKKPTLDEVLEVVQQLKQTQERQEKEIKKLKRFSNTVKYIFRNEWEERTEKWKANKFALRGLRKEQAELEGTFEVLKRAVKEIGGKEEETQKLRKRILKLEERRRLAVSNIAENPRKKVSKIERKDAVTILPEEIWKMILGNMSDSNDMWNCSNTCSIFEEHLHDWRTT